MLNKRVLTIFNVLILVASFAVIVRAQEPYRLNDKQVKRLMAQLKKDTGKFRKSLDSSLDRLSDMASFLGIMMLYSRAVPQHSLMNVFLAGVGMIASVMVSYTTARSEALGVKANVGFLQRPERIVLLIIGALSTWSWDSDHFLANRMPQVLWVLAVGSLWTMIQRMIYIRRELMHLDNQ